MESLYKMLQYGALFVKWAMSHEKVPNVLSHSHTFGMPPTQDIRGVFM